VAGRPSHRRRRRCVDQSGVLPDVIHEHLWARGAARSARAAPGSAGRRTPAHGQAGRQDGSFPERCCFQVIYFISNIFFSAATEPVHAADVGIIRL